MAATNKCSAENNKSDHVGYATKKARCTPQSQKEKVMGTLKLLLMASATTLALSGAASAATVAFFGSYDFVYSDGNKLGSGPLPYGNVTVTDQGNGVAKVVETLRDGNFIVSNGNHLPLTFNLIGTGMVDGQSVHTPYTPGDGGTNPPFGSFTDSIDDKSCTNAGNGGCGSTLSFLINNFQGFLSNELMLNGASIWVFFASDIINNAADGQTGAVGAGAPMQTPLPPALALFGAGLAGIGLLKRFTKKRNANIDLA